MKGKASHDLHCYGVLIVRPTGKFRRKLGAIPKSYVNVDQRFGNWSEQSRATQKAEAYNRRAMRQGWSTWAIVTRDDEAAKFLQAAMSVNLTLPKPQQPDSSSRAGLRIYAFNGCRRADESHSMSVDLVGGFVKVDHFKGVDLRALAIKRVEEVLAKVKAAAAKAKRAKGGASHA